MAGDHHGSTRAIIAAFLANLGIAASKFLAYIVTGSGSMLAESVHSIADAGNQGLLLLGGRRARHAPTETHPFGYGTERYFWAFIVAMVLFTLGAVFAIVEGIEKILHPHELESLGWAIGVLLVAIVLESLSFRTAIRAANAVRGDLSLWGFVRRSKAPELPVVLLEDAAALVGLFIALAAVLLSKATGDPVWDGYGTLTIGMLLAVVAIILAIEMKSLLIGEAATPEARGFIRGAIESNPNVVRLIHLRTMHLGPEEILVTAKIEPLHELHAEEVGELIDEIEAAIRVAVPDATMIFIEPDVFHAPAGAPPAAH
jgi:cation diffusion facilitator family transporter